MGGNKTRLSQKNQNNDQQRVVLKDDTAETPPDEVKPTTKISAFTLESSDPSDLESILYRELNGERKKAGLSAVRWSTALASVARSYSQEMATTGIVAHVSKISGSPSDRLMRAHIRLPGVSENLAQAGTAKEAHLGLMESPGHRANILDNLADEVGVGVAISGGSGNPIVFVTQLFALKPKSIDAMANGDQLIAMVNLLRESRGLKPLSKHPWLTSAAAAISAHYASRAVVEIPDFSSKFKHVTSVVLKTMDPAKSIQNLKELTESKETHIGINIRICRDKKMDRNMVCVIVLLGGAIE
jgi:uncharacterized protein YkwD